MKRLRAFNKFYRRYEVDLWGRVGFQRANKTVRFLKKVQREKIKFNINPGGTFATKSLKKKLKFPSGILSLYKKLHEQRENAKKKFKQRQKKIQRERERAKIGLPFSLLYAAKALKLEKAVIRRLLFKINRNTKRKRNSAVFLYKANEKQKLKSFLLNIILTKVFLHRLANKKRKLLNRKRKINKIELSLSKAPLINSEEKEEQKVMSLSISKGQLKSQTISDKGKNLEIKIEPKKETKRVVVTKVKKNVGFTASEEININTNKKKNIKSQK